MDVTRQGHPPAGPGPLHSEFATVSNELRNLKAEFNQLNRQHQRVSNPYKYGITVLIKTWTPFTRAKSSEASQKRV